MHNAHSTLVLGSSFSEFQPNSKSIGHCYRIRSLFSQIFKGGLISEALFIVPSSKIVCEINLLKVDFAIRKQLRNINLEQILVDVIKVKIPSEIKPPLQCNTVLVFTWLH